MTSPAGTHPTYDVIVVGAGTAGIPCAIAAADGGARVLLVEKDNLIGGTLHLTGGHMAAAGARRQIEMGIKDSPAEHLEDIRRISGGSARDDLVSLQAEHGAATVDWLDERGFAFAPESPRIVYGHEPYRIARTYYGTDLGVSILAVLERELERVRADCDLTIWTKTPVLGLRADDQGRICGITALRDGKDLDIDAAAVVIATGGFAADSELFEELDGAPLVSAARRTSTGDGIHLGREVGAGLQGKGTYLPTFGGLPDTRIPGRAKWEDRQNLTTERPPLEIYVNPEGKRWIAEDEPSIDIKEQRLAQVPTQTFWTVFDDAMLTQSTGSSSMIIGYSPDEIRAAANVHGGIFAADTLAELGERASIDAAGLVETVAAYNESVRAGVDTQFGRKHLPQTISDGPFYAIQNHGIALISFVGLDIDTDFCVRNESGDPIDGLYAIGEVIGAGATCGHSFVSGMMVTPALTFGRLLGERLAAELCPQN